METLSKTHLSVEIASDIRNFAMSIEACGIAEAISASLRNRDVIFLDHSLSFTMPSDTPAPHHKLIFILL